MENLFFFRKKKGKKVKKGKERSLAQFVENLCKYKRSLAVQITLSLSLSLFLHAQALVSSYIDPSTLIKDNPATNFAQLTTFNLAKSDKRNNHHRRTETIDSIIICGRKKVEKDITREYFPVNWRSYEGKKMK